VLLTAPDASRTLNVKLSLPLFALATYVYTPAVDVWVSVPYFGCATIS
jgi:hypothetical protein